jgi:hypothetical protein
MSKANVKQAALQDLLRAVWWETTDTMYYKSATERVLVQMRHNYFDVNVPGDSVLAVISHVADAIREHEGSRG